MSKSIPEKPPQLLVSVRNATEAQAALAGGCDILDVKEPSRGALGMADPAEIAAVLELGRGAKSPVAVSVALGEATDWAESISLPRLAAAPNYLKLGTAGLAESGRWPEVWRGIAERWKHECGLSSTWIVVAYADHQNAGAPSPAAVFQYARELGVAGVLIDTWDKRSSGLRGWLKDREILRLRERALAADLFFALAGKLRGADLPAISDFFPDVVGIRGAACRGHDRGAELDSEAVADFKRQLRRASRIKTSR